MSQQPVWLSDEGSLGTVPEGQYYKVEVRAYDPDFPDDPLQITYTLIAGALPDGVAVNRHGTIEGIPISIADVKGVPQEVSENVESKFTIRATTESGRIKDRTFTLTVTGQDAPDFITPPGLIGTYFDGNQVIFQFEISDDDPGDVIRIELSSGELPPGLILTEDGLLSGYILPTESLNGELAGFDTNNTVFDEFPFAFNESSINKNFQFTLQVTDGKDVNLRTFEIYVYSRDSMTADSTQFTADQDVLTVDTVSSRGPYLVDYISDFGQIAHSNFFAYQFVGNDPDGTAVEYVLSSGTLPQDLTLNLTTGWLSGYLPNIGLAETLYNFGITILTTASEPTQSIEYTFAFTTVGEIETALEWITHTEVGTINNGDISTLYVEAYHPDTILQYRFKDGEYNKLPEGVSLMSSGNIVGRVSFKTFSLDGNNTTFDADFETRLVVEEVETTFDRTFVFHVEAFSNDGFVSITKEFTIRVNREYDVPFNVLYAKALPPANDRTIINNLLLDANIIVPDYLYRADDPNFGASKEVVYNHAYGLSPASVEDYFAAMSTNHYHKTVTLGEISTARALDENDNILYEVVYSNVIDNAVNPNGVSVSDSINLSVPAVHKGIDDSENTIVSTIYPNSFENMRNQVISQIGQISKVLPTWMLSKQEDGRILGFTPAWVIAYTKPGQSKLLAYRIENDYADDINRIDFTIDRFTLSNRLTKDWEYCSTTSDTTETSTDTIEISADLDEGCSDHWADAVITTFDRILSLDGVTADSTHVTADSNRYPDSNEEVYNATADDAYITADSNHTLDIGSDPVPRDLTDFTIETETVFDSGSTIFVSPVDKFEQVTDKYDKYILFPQVEVFDANPVV